MHTPTMGKGDPVHVKACEHVFQNTDIITWDRITSVQMWSPLERSKPFKRCVSFYLSMDQRFGKLGLNYILIIFLIINSSFKNNEDHVMEADNLAVASMHWD